MNSLQFVGETSPYLFELEQLKIESNILEYKSRYNDSSHQFAEFNKTLQLASSLGSLSLLNLMNVTSKNFFLGEKLRIRKVHDKIQGNMLKFRAKSIQLSKRKGKSLVEIFDGIDELVYTFELDYNVLSEDAFIKLFKKHYVKDEEGAAIEFPQTDIGIVSEESIEVLIHGFSNSLCAGHFDNYPIVPAVFIVNRLLEAIGKFFSIKNKNVDNRHWIVDSLEIFANVAVPTKTNLSSMIYYRELAKDVFFFSCPLSDGLIEYGVYLITIKLDNR